jgi:hypothetical protein
MDKYLKFQFHGPHPGDNGGFDYDKSLDAEGIRYIMGTVFPET